MFLKPTRNVQLVKLHMSLEPMRSHHIFKCRSVKCHHFSSSSSSMLMHLPHLGTSLKFCHYGNGLLTGDEACASFHCSTQKAVVQFTPLKQNWAGHRFYVMGKWKWLFMNGCEFKGLISFTMEYLKLCQDRRDASVCLGIMLKYNETSVE